MSANAGDKSSQWQVGELLIKEGFIKADDLEKALKIQRAEETDLSIGKILVDMGHITEDQLANLNNHPEFQENIGKLAVEKGMVDAKQLAECLKNRRLNETIGERLFRKGTITDDDLAVLKHTPQDVKLGELALKLGMIDEKDLEKTRKIKGSPRTIGEILCDLKLVDPPDLNHVLQRYNKLLTFGEILRKQGIIDETKLKTALQEQRHRAEKLGGIMVQKKFITADQLYAALSRQYNIPFEKLDGFAIEDKQKYMLSSIVGRRYAEKHLILPLYIQGNKLTLAVSNPENTRVLQELKPVYSHLQMNCVLITEEKLEELYESLYGRLLKGPKTGLEQKVEPEDLDRMEIDLEEADGQLDKAAPYGISDMEAEEVVNFIIKYGIVNNASDIHIEQDRQAARLRYRMDGVLQTLKLKWLDEKLQEMVAAIISRIKVMSNLDITERRIPQDGVFRVNYFDKEKRQRFDLDFRVATCPAIVGENISIRILDSRKANVGMNRLGHSSHVLDPLMQLLKSSAGMVLVSGPTGSGKSSTLYSILQYIYHPGIKIITAEDPIEYSFPGIMQTQIKPKINLTFARLLRSFLRLDPDVILVGEMRDEETAKIGFDAAQTGHLLLSTIHTNDSFSAISRLLDLGVEHNQMASSLMCVLAQRLVRRICNSCREKYTPEESEWEILFEKFPADLRFYKGKGCDSCDYTGYNGRALISELMVVDRDVAQVLNKGGVKMKQKKCCSKAV